MPEKLALILTRPGERSGSGASNTATPVLALIGTLPRTCPEAFSQVLSAVPSEVGGATLEPALERVWPAMDSQAAAAPLLAAAASLLGRPIVPRSRGGASDASHFATLIPLTLDGLGPRGGGAHRPEEFVHLPSLGERVAVALALARAVMLLG